MKKALIIAYDFPPARTSGIYRPLKFARYLPEFGWQPVILTVKNYENGLTDAGLLNELADDVTIYRTFSFEPKRIEQFIYKSLYGKSKKEQASGALTQPNDTRPKMKSVIKRYLFSPISHFTHNSLYIPDDKIGWAPFAIRAGLKAIKREKIDVIISTSPPETNHIVGAHLKNKTGKPWLADFRDPWSYNAHRSHLSDGRLLKERQMEHRVLQNADAIVHVGHRFAQMAQSEFPDIPSDKHYAVTNGYDENDFVGIDAREEYCRNKKPYLNFVHVGMIYEQSEFDLFLRAFADIVTQPNQICDMRMTFIGNLQPYWREKLNQKPLCDYVDILGFKPHNEAVRQMMAADVLLLMPYSADSQTRDKIIPGKAFELLRAGRPILMVGWPGELSDLVEASGTGIFIPPDDLEKMRATILDFCEKKQNNGLGTEPDWDYVKRFDRKYQAGQMADILNSLLSE